tara:strand:- start:21 stop:1262 length:1242 start_codon:yes stop_codon:yes gene_type:complete
MSRHNTNKNSNNDVAFDVISLSSYTSPEIVEVVNEDFVHYGEDNNYFQEIIEYYVGSPTNGSLINGISKLIYGKGISAIDSAKKPEQYAKMLSMIKPRALKRIILDRKMLGMGAIQVTYDKGQPSKITHFPMNTLRAAKANDAGEITSWGYSADWANVKKNDKIKTIPAFGHGNSKGNEIYIITDYVPGYFYYTPPDYVQALPYAKLEDEIGDYLVNDTVNGFSGTMMVNFNTGVPSAIIQKETNAKLMRQLSGANGTKIMTSFNKPGQQATTMERFALDNAPDHYQYLSNECRDKLLMGHRISNPLLVGIKDGGSGLSNNSDEIETAFKLQNNTVIKPYQNEIIEALEEIFALSGITLQIYFKSLQPLDFYEGEVIEEEVKEEEVIEEEVAEVVSEEIAQEDLEEDNNIEKI